MINVILPGSTIGIIGGGQLGQMMALSAKEMGFKVGILDPTENCPASQVADWTINEKYDNSEALLELANRSDVLTYEFENVDSLVLAQPEIIAKLPQGIELLKISQNRKKEKEFLRGLDLPIANFCYLEEASKLAESVEKIGYPCVLKTVEGGYDGKGQVVLKTEEDLVEARQLSEKYPCVLEEWLSFEKEVSVIVTGNKEGEYECFPLAENQHRHNILHATIVPARISHGCREKAEKVALRIAEELKIVGTITIELFVQEDESLIINELAPRPHNSGHYTIEACQVSQFDQHIKGICGWSLVPVQLLKDAVMFNLIAEEQTRSFDYLAKKKDWSFHYYGKTDLKKGRKMGHITILSDSIKNTINEAMQTTIWK